MRTIAIVSMVSALVMAPTIASASGAYSCCFINGKGEPYVYRDRASSHFKGTFDDMCRAVAKERKEKRCEPTVPLRKRTDG